MGADLGDGRLDAREVDRGMDRHHRIRQRQGWIHAADDVEADRQLPGADDAGRLLQQGAALDRGDPAQQQHAQRLVLDMQGGRQDGPAIAGGRCPVGGADQRQVGGDAPDAMGEIARDGDDPLRPGQEGGPFLAQHPRIARRQGRVAAEPPLPRQQMGVAGQMVIVDEGDVVGQAQFGDQALAMGLEAEQMDDVEAAQPGPAAPPAGPRAGAHLGRRRGDSPRPTGRGGLAGRGAEGVTARSGRRGAASSSRRWTSVPPPPSAEEEHARGAAG
jgi:hypothetical protein